MRALQLIAALLAIGPACAAVEIELSGNPPLPATNAVANASMEAGDGPYPEGWATSGTPTRRR